MFIVPIYCVISKPFLTVWHALNEKNQLTHNKLATVKITKKSGRKINKKNNKSIYQSNFLKPSMTLFQYLL